MRGRSDLHHDHIPGKGIVTEPLLTSWRVGDERDFICFDFMLVYERGEVLIHSHLVQQSIDHDELFLYESVPWYDALECAITMVDDAMNYLKENGVVNPVWPQCDAFIVAVMKALNITRH